MLHVISVKKFNGPTQNLCFNNITIKFTRLHGTYDALEGGLISNATTDFTGGLSEIVCLKQMKTDFESQKRMFLNMLHAYQRRSLMGAAIFEKFVTIISYFKKYIPAAFRACKRDKNVIAITICYFILLLLYCFVRVTINR